MLSFYGVPAVIGGLSAASMAALSEVLDGAVLYHNSLYPIYPARVPLNPKDDDVLVLINREGTNMLFCFVYFCLITLR